jgi:hypothetical protein
LIQIPNYISTQKNKNPTKKKHLLGRKLNLTYLGLEGGGVNGFGVMMGEEEGREKGSLRPKATDGRILDALGPESLSNPEPEKFDISFFYGTIFIVAEWYKLFLPSKINEKLCSSLGFGFK